MSKDAASEGNVTATRTGEAGSGNESVASLIQHRNQSTAALAGPELTGKHKLAPNSRNPHVPVSQMSG